MVTWCRGNNGNMVTLQRCNYVMVKGQRGNNGNMVTNGKVITW
jgi:hypothetical protein